ncbi:homoserine dehydrogenase [Bacillus sp. FJAT-45350]|uniref:homoserine dehydrogenase n=1 Tax=Bacillus sp. FJAT-45350 TaxID=2011014 RepID=UPI000BB7C0D2|nr:homoserine dehydrogenase [Bacillus sp. FJAT-45350]
MTQKVALVGFGGVGQGLVEILRTKKPMLESELGVDVQIVAVTDIKKGALYQPEGLDLNKLMKTVKETGNLSNYTDEPGLIRDLDSIQTIKETNADTIVEITYTDVKTGQPAIDHCKTAFEHGKNVVMTNKGPVALAYKELSEKAKENGVQLLFEGTVMSGTPALRMPLTTLVGNEINEIRGIFNGTTNYMLTEMESGIAYEDALRQAQKLGYAEADPTSDVEGYDVLYKVVILANVVMGIPLKKEDVSCKGISQLTLDDINQAKEENKRWKLIGKIQNEAGKVRASVAPEKIPLNDPLASISGATNAITYECDLSGPITLVGAGAGIPETGFALLIDLINLEKGNY